MLAPATYISTSTSGKQEWLDTSPVMALVRALGEISRIYSRIYAYPYDPEDSSASARERGNRHVVQVLSPGDDEMPSIFFDDIQVVTDDAEKEEAAPTTFGVS